MFLFYFLKNSTLTFEEIRTILRESAEDQVGDPSEDVSGFDTYYGYGRLNAKNALSHQILSIDNFENANKNIVIYPNPIKANNQLEMSNLIDGDYSINIYNAFGQNLQSKNTTTYNSKITISISKLTAGIYFLRIINKSKNTSIVKKMIIK